MSANNDIDVIMKRINDISTVLEDNKKLVVIENQLRNLEGNISEIKEQIKEVKIIALKTPDITKITDHLISNDMYKSKLAAVQADASIKKDGIIERLRKSWEYIVSMGFIQMMTMVLIDKSVKTFGDPETINAFGTIFNPIMIVSIISIACLLALYLFIFRNTKNKIEVEAKQQMDQIELERLKHKESVELKESDPEITIVGND